MIDDDFSGDRPWVEARDLTVAAEERSAKHVHDDCRARIAVLEVAREAERKRRLSSERDNRQLRALLELESSALEMVCHGGDDKAFRSHVETARELASATSERNKLRTRVAELEAERERNAPLVAAAEAWAVLTADDRQWFDEEFPRHLEERICELAAAVLDAAAKRGGAR